MQKQHLRFKFKKIPLVELFTALILLASLIGELFRFKGFLILDLLAPVFAFFLCTKMLRAKNLPALFSFAFPALIFLGIGLASLLINSAEMNFGEFASSALYGARWASLFLIGLYFIGAPKKEKLFALHSVFAFSVLLAIAGFVQLAFVPDFESYEILGWDPHKNRLLGTWFDPNFIGGYFAFILPVMFGFAFEKPSAKKWILPAILVVGIALVLTLSRSAYLALALSLFFFSLIRSRKLFVTFIITAILGSLLFAPARERIQMLAQSATAVFTETYSLPDASARHRFGSWEEAWLLFMDSPLIGQGYNRYADSALKLGTLKDTNIHSANGSDSSILTILATSGILGFAGFAVLHFLILKKSWLEWKTSKNSIALGLFAGFLGIFLHSIFVNSLLFPLLLAPLWILTGAILRLRES